MNKQDLIQKFIYILESDLKLAIESQKNTVDYVIDEDNKPENEYDTRGLEASYLARGQAERVADLKESLALFKTIEIKKYSPTSPIGNSALITILDLNNETDRKTVLFMPKGGGLQLRIENIVIQTVTASSPLGSALLNKKVGDEISYTAANSIKEYEILTVE